MSAFNTVRAPRFSARLIFALRTLIQHNLIRVLLDKMRDLQVHYEPPEESTVQLVSLTNELIDMEQPLIVASAMMEYNKAPYVLIPMSKERFNVYWNIINTFMRSSETSALSVDQIAQIEEGRAELKRAFETAETIDLHEMAASSKKPQNNMLLN